LSRRIKDALEYSRRIWSIYGSVDRFETGGFRRLFDALGISRSF